MSHIPIISNENATEDQAALFKGAEAMMGRVANAVRVAANAPKLAQALFGFLVPALREEISGAVSIELKALVILKTSMLNGCNYCIGHNTSLGKSLEFSDQKIEAIEGDFQNSPHFTDSEKAAIAWAECLTEKTYRQRPEVMETLKLHYTDEQIVEITMLSGFFNFWNRFTDGLQVDIEPKDQVGLIRRSKKVDVNEYVDYMNSCWWNKS